MKMEELLHRLLWAQLNALGAFEDKKTTVAALKTKLGLKEMYGRWLRETLADLERNRYVRLEGESVTVIDLAPVELEAVWRQWEAAKASWLTDPATQARVALAEAMLRALPEILTGKVPATDVMFPNASLKLVEGIYQHNPVADYFNDVLANTVTVYLQRRIKQDPQVKVSLIEIGAGTGGTSAAIFPKLQPYQSHIREYCYTDISKAFLLHAQKEYGTANPYLTTRLYNVETPLAGQDLPAGGFDLAIATNVLHATKNIRRTLRNAKAVLRKNGLILINEISGNALFAHLTFGLLEGWWLYEDPQLRIPGCPGLYPESWKAVLESEGFGPVFFPAQAQHGLGQQIIVAQSDGVVWQERPVTPKVVASLETSVPVAPQKQRVLPKPLVQAHPADSSAMLRDKTIAYLKQMVAETLKMAVHLIDASEPLEKYGIDSIIVVELTNKLAAVFENITSTLFFEFQTLDALAAHLLRTQPQALVKLFGLEEAELAIAATGEDRQTVSRDTLVPLLAKSPFGFNPAVSKQVVASEDPQVTEIAIIGVAGRYPGAHNLDEFWANLKEGKDCVTEIPPERWDQSLYYDPDPAQPGKVTCKWGGFIDEVERFDPLFFNIAPREAEIMDPQERLFLECVWNGLEDAGYTRRSLANSKVGVFVGAMYGLYQLFGLETSRAGQGAAPSSVFASIANRVSYFFNFRGPSMALDTMCSSSLTALHLACESLRRGESEVAIAGGVNISIHPYKYQMLSMGKFTASDGRCHSFGAGGDGFVPGEGVGVAILKPLWQAQRDGDQIYGVIKGSAINHGGKTNGYTVPSVNQQAALIAEVLRKTGINPRTLSYLEAHGTGTELGDPIEISALTKAFGEYTQERQYCSIGSAKSNIGHLEAAAGIAGLTKILLQLKHQFLVPSLHSETLNPNINFATSPFYVQHRFEEWRQPVITEGGTEKRLPRRAGISAFGAGGSNAHLIIEEYPSARRQVKANGPQLFILSAKNTERLREYVKLLLAFLNREAGEAGPENTEFWLADLIYTLQVGREAMEERLAFTVASSRELAEKLTRVSQGDLNFDGLFTGNIHQPAGKFGILVNGSEGEEFLELLINNNKLEKLAQLWVAGMEIPWEKLYRGGYPNRISLPTYPFARQKCWVELAAVNPPQNDPMRFAQDPIQTNCRAAKQWEHSPADLLVYRSEWVESEVESADFDIGLVEKVLVFGDDAARYAQFSAAVRQRGCRQLIFVQPGTAFRELDPQHFEIDPEDFTHYTKLFSALQALDLLPTQILQLWPLSNVTKGETGAAEVFLAEQQTKLLISLRAVFYITKAFAPVGGKTLQKMFFVSVSQDPFYEAIGGFAKSLKVTWPEFTFTTVSLDGNPRDIPRDLAELLLPELGRSGKQYPQELEFREGRRYVRRLVPFQLQPSAPLPLKQGGVYLITGGLGGLGLVFARFLAREYRAKLVLTGRSPRTASQDPRIAELMHWGAEVNYLPADVANPGDMGEVMAVIRRQYGRLNGVFHSAGIMSEKPVLEKTDTEFATILKPKIEGTVILDALTATANLDIFVLFSSMSALLGDFGRCDYAAGNRFMDVYAQWREQLREKGQRQGRTIAIQWPLWREGGMHLDREWVNATGLAPLETEVGLKAFAEAVQTNESQVMVLFGDPHKFEPILQIGQRKPVAVQSLPVQVSRVDSSGIAAKMGREIQALAASLIKVTPEQINPHLNLGDYGFESITLKELANGLNRMYHVEISPIVFFNHNTVQEIVTYLLAEFGAEMEAHYQATEIPVKNYPPLDLGNEIPQMKRTNLTPFAEQVREQTLGTDRRLSPGKGAEPVAIVGLSGVFPGSRDVEEFWAHLERQDDLVTEVPAGRWDWRQFYSETGAESDKGVSKWGGFIPDVDRFDASFFRIPPLEAEYMDPQQRFIIENVWRALENAGYKASNLAGQPVGVYIGAQFNDYQGLLSQNGEFHPFLATGNAHAMLSNRISYLFDFHGPSETIDAACSSSLVAIHHAVRSLQTGEVNLAIAGGVSLMLSPYGMIGVGQLGVLSADGRCKTFSKDANGYVKGEGVGIVVLKPLSQAVQDGDYIHAVIKGSAINHGGKAHSLTAPNAAAQASLLVAAYEAAGFDPATVSYIEAHGTGTELGDPIEVEGLKTAFQRLAQKRGQSLPTHYCGLGSVKTNIGHLEPAAGIAGILKLVLAMEHRKLPGVLHLKEVNPFIHLNATPFYIVEQTREWERLTDSQGNPVPRRAGVSSFGFGGANGHIVLEEYERPQPEDWSDERTPQLFVLSARTQERLQCYATQWRAFLTANQAIRFGDLIHTLQNGREMMECRLAIICSNSGELAEQLNAFVAGTPSPGVFWGNTKATKTQMDLLGQDEELVELLNHWVAKGRLNKLAELWVGGLEIDWNQLNLPGGGCKIPLPTYPFADERYWLPGTLKNQPVSVALPEVAAVSETESKVRQVIANRTGYALETITGGQTLSELNLDSVHLLGISHELIATFQLEKLENEGNRLLKQLIGNDLRVSEICAYLDQRVALVSPEQERVVVPPETPVANADFRAQNQVLNEIHAHTKTNASNLAVHSLRIGAISPLQMKATLAVDESHPFFFDHPLDHVSGMQLAEAISETVKAGYLYQRALEPRSPLWISQLELVFKHYCRKEPLAEVTVSELAEPGHFAAEIWQEQKSLVSATLTMAEIAPQNGEKDPQTGTTKPIEACPKKMVNKHHQDNVLVSRPLKRGSDFHPRCGLVFQPQNDFYGDFAGAQIDTIVLAEACRQSFRIFAAAHFKKMGDETFNPGELIQILKSLTVRLTRPVYRHEALYFTNSAFELVGSGNNRVLNVQAQLRVNEETVGSYTLSALLLDKSILAASENASGQ